MSKVSILIPTYNREQFIESCIKSAQNQTYKDIEIIIVDNKSTDSTYEKCKAVQMGDSRIKVYQNESNIGPVLNWKKCLEKSTGKYVKFLFSDDLMDPSYISSTIGFLEDGRTGFVLTSCKIGEKEENSKIAYRSVKLEISKMEYLQGIASAKYPYSPCAAIFRREDVLASLDTGLVTASRRNYNKNGAGPDLLIYLNIINGYSKVIAVDEPLVFFRAHNESITVADKSGTVMSGYYSTLLWYFNKHSHREEWLLILLKYWMLVIKNPKLNIRPNQFLNQIDGSLDCFDLFYAFKLIYRIVKTRVLSRI